MHISDPGGKEKRFILKTVVYHVHCKAYWKGGEAEPKSHSSSSSSREKGDICSPPCKVALGWLLFYLSWSCSGLYSTKSQQSSFPAKQCFVIARILAQMVALVTARSLHSPKCVSCFGIPFSISSFHLSYSIYASILSANAVSCTCRNSSLDTRGEGGSLQNRVPQLFKKLLLLM